MNAAPPICCSPDRQVQPGNLAGFALFVISRQIEAYTWHTKMCQAA